MRCNTLDISFSTTNTLIGELKTKHPNQTESMLSSRSTKLSEWHTKADGRVEHCRTLEMRFDGQLFGVTEVRPEKLHSRSTINYGTTELLFCCPAGQQFPLSHVENFLQIVTYWKWCTAQKWQLAPLSYACYRSSLSLRFVWGRSSESFDCKKGKKCKLNSESNL